MFVTRSADLENIHKKSFRVGLFYAYQAVLKSILNGRDTGTLEALCRERLHRLEVELALEGVKMYEETEDNERA